MDSDINGWNLLLRLSEKVIKRFRDNANDKNVNDVLCAKPKKNIIISSAGVVD